MLVSTVDRQAIGPNGSVVGLATLNGWFHRLTGVCMPLYVITDWLGLVPIAVALGFALVGLVQWCKRRSIAKVDRDLLALGGFYLVVMAAYLLFEEVVVNYRPVLIDGFLEASYPSSTTLLVLCVIPTAIRQLRRRLRRGKVRTAATALFSAFAAFMVIGRVMAGVHWLTDILGGMLLSGALVALYCATAEKFSPAR